MPGSIAACSTSRPRSSAGAAWTPDADGCRARRARGLIQAQAAAVDLATAEPAWGERRRRPDRAARRGDPRARIHPDPARPARGRRSRPARGARRPAAVDRRGGAWRPARARGDRGAGRWATPETALTLAGPTAGDRRWPCCASWPAPTACWPRTTRSPAILHALDGRFIRPAPGGDLLRTPAVLPTGPQPARLRPLPHPQRLRGAGRRAAGGSGCSPATRPTATRLPETVAIVLWGTDNLKTEGGPIAQALALIGARAALRQLWPPRRRRADPAGGARPAARST